MLALCDEIVASPLGMLGFSSEVLTPAGGGVFNLFTGGPLGQTLVTLAVP